MGCPTAISLEPSGASILARNLKQRIIENVNKVQSGSKYDSGHNGIISCHSPSTVKN